MESDGRYKQEEEKRASKRSNGGKADKRSNGGKASKGSNRRKKEWKDGSGKEKRRQGVKKMNTGEGKELTGFGQDHWEGEMRNWYQDQWWGFKELERKVGDERIWEDGEILEKDQEKNS